MAVSVLIGSHQQVEWMAAVIANDGRELKAVQRDVFPWTFEHAIDCNFMPLVKGRETALSGEVCLIRREVAEVRGVVIRFAVGVVRNNGVMLAKPLLELKNATLIKSGGVRLILIVLQYERIYKTYSGNAALGCTPVLELVAIDGSGQGGGGKKIGVSRLRQPQGVNVNVVCRDRHVLGNFTLYSERCLFSIGIVECRGHVVHVGEWRQRSTIGGVDSKLSEIGCGNASAASRSARPAGEPTATQLTLCE